MEMVLKNMAGAHGTRGVYNGLSDEGLLTCGSNGCTFDRPAC